MQCKKKKKNKIRIHELEQWLIHDQPIPFAFLRQLLILFKTQLANPQKVIIKIPLSEFYDYQITKLF